MWRWSVISSWDPFPTTDFPFFSSSLFSYNVLAVSRTSQANWNSSSASSCSSSWPSSSSSSSASPEKDIFAFDLTSGSAFAEAADARTCLGSMSQVRYLEVRVIPKEGSLAGAPPRTWLFFCATWNRALPYLKRISGSSFPDSWALIDQSMGYKVKKRRKYCNSEAWP